MSQVWVVAYFFVDFSWRMKDIYIYIVRTAVEFSRYRLFMFVQFLWLSGDFLFAFLGKQSVPPKLQRIWLLTTTAALLYSFLFVSVYHSENLSFYTLLSLIYYNSQYEFPFFLECYSRVFVMFLSNLHQGYGTMFKNRSENRWKTGFWYMFWGLI